MGASQVDSAVVGGRARDSARPTDQPQDRGSSRRRTPLRTIPAQLLCLAYMVLLIGASIRIDRVIASRLFAEPNAFVPAYRSFQDYDVGVKLQQFRGAENEHFDGFFIGNSRTMFGVNPAVFDATLARAGVRFHSYNLAEESVDVRFWQPFFTRYYQRPPPRYLFLGVLPRDLDAGYTAQGAQYMNAFFASAGFQNRNLSAINRAADEKLSRLFILRGRIADVRLLSLSDILHGRKLSLDQARLADAQGWMQLPSSVLATPKSVLRAQVKALAHRHGNTPFVLGTAQKRALVALNTWERRGGGCLILYTTPLLYDSEPWGTVEMRQGFTRTMRSLVDTIPGLQFVDVGAHVENSYTVADFGDGDHLNGQGASLFSAQLATALRSAMTSSACRSS
jgi:hypothetical protein